MPILFEDPTIMSLHKKLVGIKLMDYLVINGFQNCYLNDYSYPHENCIFMLFKPIEFTHKFKTLCTLLENHKEYKTTYDVENGVVIVFNIPENRKKDVELIKNGKYSKVSTSYKALFPQIVRDKKGNKILWENWMILNKHPQYRKKLEERVGQEVDINAELHDAFSPKYEIMNYSEEYVDITW